MSTAYSNTETARRAAVSKAWAKERALVEEGRGTRNWSKSEQAQILSTGKCKGYHGHHKFSVKENPPLAGDEKNIQFLTAKEHRQAHDNNYKNDPRGRFDPDTGKVVRYADGKPKAEPTRELSEKLTDRQKSIYNNRYARLQEEKRLQTKQKAAEKAKSHERLAVHKQTAKQTEVKDGKTSSKTPTKTSMALRNAPSSKDAASKGNPDVKTSRALSNSKEKSAISTAKSSSEHTASKGKSSVALSGTRSARSSGAKGHSSASPGTGTHGGHGSGGGGGHGSGGGGGHGGGGGGSH